jgi:hypothetical protein
LTKLLIPVDDMGYVQLLPGDAGWRLPTEGEVEARADRLVGRYDGAEAWTAPVDGDELPGSWFDPVDLPEPIEPAARQAVSDLVRGIYTEE